MDARTIFHYILDACKVFSPLTNTGSDFVSMRRQDDRGGFSTALARFYVEPVNDTSQLVKLQKNMALVCG